MRKERVEETLRASGVLSCEERLLELGKVPHDGLLAQRVDEGLHAALELADPNRTRVQLRGGRLEEDDVVVEPVEGGAGERRLPDSVLADDEDRARR